MGGPSMKQSEVDYGDVQGLVRFGYGKMKEASYAHLRVKDVAAARAWLRNAPVTSADRDDAASVHRDAGRFHGRRSRGARRTARRCGGLFCRSS